MVRGCRIPECVWIKGLRVAKGSRIRHSERTAVLPEFQVRHPRPNSGRVDHPRQQFHCVGLLWYSGVQRKTARGDVGGVDMPPTPALPPPPHTGWPQGAGACNAAHMPSSGKSVAFPARHALGVFTIQLLCPIVSHAWGNGRIQFACCRATAAAPNGLGMREVMTTKPFVPLCPRPCPSTGSPSDRCGS